MPIRVWQWEDLELHVGDHALDHTMMEVNVRLYSPYEADPLTGGTLTAKVALDDVKVVCEDGR